MTNQEYADEIQRKEDIILSLQGNRKELLDNWTRYLCPIKVGDTVKCNDYSYEGKKLIVERVYPTDRWVHAAKWDEKWSWVAFGPLLKKDGTPSKNYGKYTEVIKGIRKSCKGEE